MSEQPKDRPKSGAETVKWRLEDLYADILRLDADLASADQDASDFAAAYRGRVTSLGAEELAEALRHLESIQERVGRAQSYAFLAWCTDTEKPERGALLQRIRETTTEIGKNLLFFELEWIARDDESAERLLRDPAVSRYRHYLEVQRLFKKHVLSEPEEKILAEKVNTGAGAWARFFDELLGALEFNFGDEVLTEQEILNKLHDPEREVRRSAAATFTGGLNRHIRTLTFVFNTVLADKFSDDRLRNYSGWMSARNLSNEIPDEVVDALIGAVTGRYSLAVRYYRLKARLLEIDQLEDFDRYAPLPGPATHYTWDEARKTVVEAYYAFHSTVGSIVGDFFEHRWIDAAIKPGKRGGAFSHSTVPSAHPYIMVNYTGKLRDVQTLAHELGHGVHQFLSRPQGIFQASTPLTMAETASVFGEMLVFQRVLSQLDDPEERLRMLVGKIDDTMATVFRQVALNRFEDAIHTARRTEGELSAKRFSELWIQTQSAMFEDSVKLSENYGLWWSYIPHFIHTPGYVYAYAFGELMVLALFAIYREQGPEFAEKYLRLLGAGGSDWPQNLLSQVGVDLGEAGFWQKGLDIVEEMIREAEELSSNLGRSLSDSPAQAK